MGRQQQMAELVRDRVAEQNLPLDVVVPRDDLHAVVQHGRVRRPRFGEAERHIREVDALRTARRQVDVNARRARDAAGLGPIDDHADATIRVRRHDSGSSEDGLIDARTIADRHLQMQRGPRRFRKRRRADAR